MNFAIASSWSPPDCFTTGAVETLDPRVQTGDLDIGASNPPSSAVNVLWEVREGGVWLRAAKAPITVRIRRVGNFWFAENAALRVFAHGDTAPEALRDFHQHVVYFYQYYEKLRADQVVGEGSRLKHLFANSFLRA